MKSIQLIKGLSDLKDYRLITLPSSGLEVLMVSSLALAQMRSSQDGDDAPNAVKAAAAMSVQVGSYADPIEAGNDYVFQELCYWIEF